MKNASRPNKLQRHEVEKAQTYVDVRLARSVIHATLTGDTRQDSVEKEARRQKALMRAATTQGEGPVCRAQLAC